MGSPVPVEKAEAVIYEYIRLRYQLMRGEINKLCIPFKEKCDELGMSVRHALRLIRYAKDVGMVPWDRRWEF